jgi:hypothetical protein
MAKEQVDFYAHPPDLQEAILCNLPGCCRFRRINVVEWIEDEYRYFNGVCPGCKKRATWRFRRDWSDLG